MSLRSPILLGAALCALVTSVYACDQCGQRGFGQFQQPSFYQPNSVPTFASPGYLPTTDVQAQAPGGIGSYSPTPAYGAGGYVNPYHSQCSDPNCRTCPPSGIAAPYGQSSGLNHQCGPNCNHQAGYGHGAGCTDGNCQGHNHGSTLPANTLPANGRPATAGRAGVCPVDGRQIGQFGPAHSVVVNGNIVHTCSGQCANVLRGYSPAPAMRPGMTQPQWSNPLPTLR